MGLRCLFLRTIYAYIGDGEVGPGEVKNSPGPPGLGTGQLTQMTRAPDVIKRFPSSISRSLTMTDEGIYDLHRSKPG